MSAVRKPMDFVGLFSGPIIFLSALDIFSEESISKSNINTPLFFIANILLCVVVYNVNFLHLLFEK